MTLLLALFAVGVPACFGLLMWGVSLWGYSEDEFTKPRDPVSRSAPAVTAVFGGLLLLSAAASLLLVVGAYS